MASEILSVSHTAGVTNSESVLINGVNGHTYTILSITFCETAAAAETFDLYIDDGGGGTDSPEDRRKPPRLLGGMGGFRRRWLARPDAGF